MSEGFSIRQAWTTQARAPQLWSAYAQVARGEGPGDAELADAARTARERGEAGLVCDFTSVRALRAARHQDLDGATELARTATRMARTEALRASECFANVVLARVRRLQGEPHRAMRILRALLGYAPAPFHEWIEWELALTAPASSFVTESASALASLFRAVGAGDHQSCARIAAHILKRSGPAGLHAQDLAVVGVAAGLELAPEMRPPKATAWQRGEGTGLPWGLSGLSESPQPVYVLVRPDRPGSRLLDLGLPLTGHAERLPPTPGPSNRPDSLLAALGLVGPRGEDDARLFEAVYGFPFVPATHQGVLDVLVHRARARLGELGRIERIPEGYALLVPASLCVHDTRSQPRDDDRVLRLVAARGTLTAREAAGALGVSLRKAQQVLDSLAGSGACMQIRAGRHFEYRVEDTTFQEPTGVGGS